MRFFDLHPLNHPPIPPSSSILLSSMATSLLLAAPLCFRRHGSTPFHQQPDDVEVAEEEATFNKAAAEGCNLLPLKRSIFSDHLTPSFLFESVKQGSDDTNVGRYSVIGAQPAMEVVAKANHVTVVDHEMKSKTEQLSPDPMKIPRAIMEQWNPQIIDGLPDAFCGREVDSDEDNVRKMCKNAEELEITARGGRRNKAGRVGRRSRKEYKTSRDQGLPRSKHGASKQFQF